MRSFPFDSIVEAMGEDGLPIYDRAYSAEDFREVLKTFFTNGVFLDQANAFQVTAGSAMTVTVAPGKGLINGTTCWEQDKRTLEITEAGSYDRIDTVVLRWNVNLEARNIDLYVVKGTEGTSPSRPNLTRTESVYELGIADIFIPRQTTAISNGRITDTRPENERCGIVTPFAKIDTTSFYEQLNSAFEELSDELKDQTDKAVELAKSVLDGTTAGHLQNQIDDAVDQLEKINDLTTGINLLRGTRDFVLGTDVSETKEKVCYDGFAMSSDLWTLGKDESGFTTLKSNGTHTKESYVWCSYISAKQVKGSTLTASFDFRITNKGNGTYDRLFQIVAERASDGAFSSEYSSRLYTLGDVGLSFDSIELGKWYRAVVHYPKALNLDDGYFIRTAFCEGEGGRKIEFRKAKVEIGDVNYPIWSASPFDYRSYSQKLAIVGDGTEVGRIDTNYSAKQYVRVFTSSDLGKWLFYAADGGISLYDINSDKTYKRAPWSPVPITDGGTGAVNLADAKKNLQIPSFEVKTFKSSTFSNDPKESTTVTIPITGLASNQKALGIVGHDSTMGMWGTVNNLHIEGNNVKCIAVNTTSSNQGNQTVTVYVLVMTVG